MQKVYVVIPNWNGKDRIGDCLDSLLVQVDPHQIIVVDNGSVDGSVKFLENNYPQVQIIKHNKNYGFAGGVNSGIKMAIEQGAEHIALLNNDAVADKTWLKELVNFLGANPKVGIATSKICDSANNQLDSTGEAYSIWGLAFPRGRGEPAGSQYDEQPMIFGASGGASLYRTKMLRQIGLFDQDFFAYYEDVDLSFRAQLAGWLVAYVPQAVVQHQIGATSGQIKDFTTYHTLKNLPWLMWKNVPWALMPKVLPRLVLGYFVISFGALLRGQFWAVFKGMGVSILLWPKKLAQRHKIQQNRKTSIVYINTMITHDLPPGAHKLRKLRTAWWKLLRRSQ